MAGVMNERKGDGHFTKSIFLTGALKERFVPAYLLAQEESINLDFPFVSDMLQNHRRCAYWTLLQQICPCSLDFRRRETRKKKKYVLATVNEVVSVKHVFLFVRRIFVKVIPLCALGNIQNRNRILKYVKEIIFMPIYGKMSASFMMTNIQTKFIPWLKSYGQSEQRTKLQEFINFLMLSFVGPLIQSFFYVTHNGCTNQLLFYRKKVWHCLIRREFKTFVRECKLKTVPIEWIEQESIKGKCLGFAVAHFMPKKTSLRPVINCSKRSNGRVSVNDHLKSLHLVLSFERERQQEKFGSSILGMDEFHQRWKQYHMSMKNKCIRRYYCVKTDLLKCFDNIDPSLLYEIIQQLLQESYIFYKYKKTLSKDGTAKTIYFESLKAPTAMFKATPQATYCVGSYELKRHVLLEKLHALLFCSVIKLKRQLFVQTVGIPQGACISSLLCAAYFGHMDRTALADLLGPHNFLVRMTDDMLFITPHKEKAKAFLRLMLDGVPGMNCSANFSKCCINFNFVHPVLGKVHSIDVDEAMKFCGICLNLITLETYLDYSNYMGKKASEIVSWELTQNVGMNLKKKIQKSFHPKCFSVLFDADINSEECIVHNIACIFAVCAVKFHYLVMKLPPKQRASKNPAFFTRIVQSLPNCLVSYVVRKLEKVSNVCHKKLVFPVSKDVLSSLCNHTFLYKLKRHHVIYTSVIENLRKIERRKGGTCIENVLKAIPEIFNSINIKY